MKSLIRVDSDESECNIGYKLIKLNTFDVALMMILPAFLGIIIAGWFKFIPAKEFWVEGFFNILVILILLVFIIHLSINPQPTLSFTKTSISTDINLPGILLSELNFDQSEKKWYKIKKTYKNGIKNLKSTILLRLSLIFIAFLLGFIIISII